MVSYNHVIWKTLPMAKTLHFPVVISISGGATLVFFIGAGWMLEPSFDKTL